MCPCVSLNESMHGFWGTSLETDVYQQGSHLAACFSCYSARGSRHTLVLAVLIFFFSAGYAYLFHLC